MFYKRCTIIFNDGNQIQIAANNEDEAIKQISSLKFNNKTYTEDDIVEIHFE